MKLYYSGSEIKTWRDLLAEQNIATVSLSYVGLKRRLKTSESWSVANNYPQFQHIFLDSGGYTFNREDSEHTVEEAQDMAASYMVFVQNNIDRVELVSEFDAQILGADAIRSYRTDFYSQLDPEKFMPIWHAEAGINELERLCSMYNVVGIRQHDAKDTTLIPVLNSVVNRYGVKLHGVAITSKDMMKEVNFASVSSTSWLSPSVFGDTIIWTGRELKRYPKAYKSARKRHRSYLTDNGFDAEKIEADDSTELLKLSVWSWEQFVDSISHKALTTQRRGTGEFFTESDDYSVDTDDQDNQNEQLLPAIRESRETQILPVMGVRFGKDQEAASEDEELPFLIKRSESMRVCDTCFLREKCPGFKPKANCLYNIPIEVKTTDQMRALQDALIEMQTQRVLFMQMAEDLEGGYADPNLSSEMDRLQRMIKAKNDSLKDTLSINISASTASGPGLMAKVFGSAATEKMKALPEPVNADNYIKETDIYEAELVDEH